MIVDRQPAEPQSVAAALGLGRHFRGWLKWVWIQTLPEDSRISRSGSSSSRCGRVTGTRVPIRMTSTCGMALRAFDEVSQLF